MPRFEREQSEYMEKLVFLNRVSKTVKGGRVAKFSALMVVGDGKGKVGYGLGKAAEVPEAIRKGLEAAKKNMITVTLDGTTIPHETIGEFGAGPWLRDGWPHPPLLQRGREDHRPFSGRFQARRREDARLRRLRESGMVVVKGMKVGYSLLAVLMPFLAFAENARAPMDWHPVQTNGIARWKAENKAPDGVVADVAARSVRFLAEATGTGAGETVEFFAIGPLSDRAYESLLVTVASPTAIAAAFDKIGLPPGVGANPMQARLWPYGEKVEISVKPWGVASTANAGSGLTRLVKDVRTKEEGDSLSAPVVWTAGARDGRDMPIAATNMPCAVFALYNHAPSLLQLDGLFDQTSTYGRYVAATTQKAGELFEVTATWDGKPHVKDVELKLSESNAVARIAALQETAKRLDVHVRLAFDASVTVARAATYVSDHCDTCAF